MDRCDLCIAKPCTAEKTFQYPFDDAGENIFDFLDSVDMEKLARAIDVRCSELNIRPDSIEGQMVASQLLGMFQSGVTDEVELSTRPISLEIIQRHG